MSAPTLPNPVPVVDFPTQRVVYRFPAPARTPVEVFIDGLLCPDCNESKVTRPTRCRCRPVRR